MTTAKHREVDIARVRQAIVHRLIVHPRVVDQGHEPDAVARRALCDALPEIYAFHGKAFRTVRAILDWDHQLPSSYYMLRILASYSDEGDDDVDSMIAERGEEIAEGNLYPEFDVPDYSDIEAGENYVAVIAAGSLVVEDVRFLSTWRRNVDVRVADLATEVVKRDSGYQAALKGRKAEGLGGAVVIGWAPPCLAHSSNWGVELWLLTEFDGSRGKARVFMVDTEHGTVSREYNTDVQLA